METKKETLKRRPKHRINITEKQADNIADNLVSYKGYNSNKNNYYYSILCMSIWSRKVFVTAY